MFDIIRLPVVNQTIKGIACHKYLTGKNIRVNADQDLPECNSNALDIQRVLQNLIINAGFITQEGGNGLSLLSCKSIVEEHHNGKLWYETEMGKGTVFYFTIPLETNGSK